MSDEKCILDPQRDCIGIKRADEVAGDMRTLDIRLSGLQQSVSETNNRFGGRIGKLEAHNDVQDEQVRQIKETQAEIKREIAEAQQEQKNSISELRREHKESMEELKKSNKEILDAVTPLKHKVESLEHLPEEVNKIKEKPGETWEHIKKQGLGWLVALGLAILAVALGLGNICDGRWSNAYH